MKRRRPRLREGFIQNSIDEYLHRLELLGAASHFHLL
jgi:hypothetical protein